MLSVGAQKLFKYLGVHLYEIGNITFLTSPPSVSICIIARLRPIFRTPVYFTAYIGITYPALRWDEPTDLSEPKSYRTSSETDSPPYALWWL